MSSYRPKRVLIADDKPRRVKAVRGPLARHWKVPLTIISTPEEAFDESRAVIRQGELFDVIMVAFGFGGVDHGKILKRLFQLFARADTIGVLIADRSYPLPTGTPARHLLIVPQGAREVEYSLLEVILASPPEKLPTICNGGQLSSALRLQIRELDSEGGLETGKKVLCQLVGQLKPRLEKFCLHGLGQGFSGAKVFGISDPSRTKDDIEWVLKLTRDSEYQAWKCEHELNNYSEIRSGLTRGPLRLIPEIYGDARASGQSVLPAECGNWLAVMYDFLGGKGAFVCDFERVFLDPEACLSELTALSSIAGRGKAATELPIRFLEKLVEDLCGWYSQGPHPRVRGKPLWSADEAPPRGPLIFPPYRFRRWEKAKIIESIRLLEQYGASLPRARWRIKSDRARVCVPTTRRLPNQLSHLGDHHPTLLTPVHADLNANNVLMALDHDVPFLIDFACYQPLGHNVQDFARLEVAIKIELMGRERAGPEGKDLNSNEFAKWCRAEDWLAEWPNDDSGLRTLGPNHDSVVRAYGLGLYLRRKSWEFHRSMSRSYRRADFIRSYNAALLYHTLRAIGYDSLSYLKRIFAVYSAGGIAKDL